MNFISNQFILDNGTLLIKGFLLAFLISLLLTPAIGRLAKLMNAVDLPASMRKVSDKTSLSRINTEPKLKLGGIAIFSSFIIALLITGYYTGLNKGIIVGLFIIIFIAFLDDKFEVSGKFQLVFQILAALAVVVGGISVTHVSFLNTPIDLNWFSYMIGFRDFTYNFIFPADLLTIFWIVGIINVINWVGGIDDLNPSISAVIAGTMMLLALDSVNLTLAIILAIYLGSLLGFFPYNYYPSRIIQGATGDLLNGYLLAVFAIIGGTTWTSTFILLALPIIDAFIVVYLRLKAHPKARKNPLLLLSISDTNHLHHRLLAVGYTRKTVLWIEIAMMSVVCTIAVYFSGIRRDVVSFIICMTMLVVIFATVFFLKNRATKVKVASRRFGHDVPKERAVVRVILDENKDEEEKFIY